MSAKPLPFCAHALICNLMPSRLANACLYTILVAYTRLMHKELIDLFTNARLGAKHLPANFHTPITTQNDNRPTCTCTRICKKLISLITNACLCAKHQPPYLHLHIFARSTNRPTRNYIYFP